MKSKIIIVQFALFLIIGSLNAQVLVSETVVSVDSSAIFEIKSTDKGFLPPRMTKAQRDSISNPANGLSIYCTDCKELQIYTDSTWTNILGQHPKDNFECGDSILYEGQYYSTILIGSQCWFSENLNVGERVTSSYLQINNDVIEKQCYNNDSINCDIYGGLYTFFEMMNYQANESVQGICPDGWHIPSDYDFVELELALDMNPTLPLYTNYRGTDQGSQLAGHADLWASSVLISNPAFGSSGFDTKPGGFASSTSYSDMNQVSYFWTSSVLPGTNNIYYRLVHYGNPRVYRNTKTVDRAYSIRCIQD